MGRGGWAAGRRWKWRKRVAPAPTPTAARAHSTRLIVLRRRVIPDACKRTGPPALGLNLPGKLCFNQHECAGREREHGDPKGGSSGCVRVRRCAATCTSGGDALHGLSRPADLYPPGRSPKFTSVFRFPCLPPSRSLEGHNMRVNMLSILKSALTPCSENNLDARDNASSNQDSRSIAPG